MERFARHAAWSLALAMLAAPSARAQQAVDTGAVRRAIDDGNRRWADAWKQGDAAALVALFADSGTQLATRTGRATHGRAALDSLFRGQFAGPRPVDVQVITENLYVTGGSAVETGHYAYIFPSENAQERAVRGRYVTIWRRQADGSWRIYVDMGLPNE
jgi:uncharacterized protein (TIGR02246 family)